MEGQPPTSHPSKDTKDTSIFLEKAPLSWQTPLEMEKDSKDTSQYPELSHTPSILVDLIGRISLEF